MPIRLPTVFDKIKSTDDRSEKINIISKYGYDNLLRKVLRMTYSPVINFGFKDYHPQAIGKEHGLGISKFIHVLDDILDNKFTDEESKFACNLALKNINSDEVGIFLGIINKDQNIGIDIDLINEAITGLIPAFPCQYPTFGTLDDLKAIEFPAVVQKNYPGKHITIIVNGESVQFRDQHGEIVDYLDNFKKYFSDLAQNNNVSIEGALIFAIDGNVVQEQPEDFSDVPAECIRFILWDIIKNDKFFEGEDTRLGYNWRMNGIEHMMMLAANSETSNIYDIPLGKPVSNIEEAMKLIDSEYCIVKSLSSIWVTGENPQHLMVLEE